MGAVDILFTAVILSMMGAIVAMAGYFTVQYDKLQKIFFVAIIAIAALVFSSLAFAAACGILGWW